MKWLWIMDGMHLNIWSKWIFSLFKWSLMKDLWRCYLLMMLFFKPKPLTSTLCIECTNKLGF
jgi:hypothetical protein